MRNRILISVAIAVTILYSQPLAAQIFQGTSNEDISLGSDTLILKEEWWLGFSASGSYNTAFGALTSIYVGGTAPGSQSLYARTDGGFGYGVAFAPCLEYRPYRSSLSAMISLGVDYRHSVSKSTEPISNGIFAHNALYEAQNSVLYGTIGLTAKFAITHFGLFIMAGPTLEIPFSSSSYIWQHEILKDDQTVGEEPGFPNTSIKFAIRPTWRPRVGMHIGIGKDIIVGLFGYINQVITPYISVQGATPDVSEPTSWNTIIVRGGLSWRIGI